MICWRAIYCANKFVRDLKIAPTQKRYTPHILGRVPI